MDKLRICSLPGCRRYGVLSCSIVDTVSVFSMRKPETLVVKSFCCKTHMLRYLQKVKMPRYSKKQIQRLVGTKPLAFKGTRKVKTKRSITIGNPIMSEDIEK